MKKIDLHPKVNIILSNRHNGLSKNRFESLNLGLHVGDNPLHVRKNREIFASYFDTNIQNLVFMNQVHGDNVEIVNTTILKDTDSIITKSKDLVLCVMVADCAPIILFDSQNDVIAALHAGRAGVFLDIISKTIKKMKDDFGTKNEYIYAYIGPFIKSCCYEIDGEVLRMTKKDFDFAILKKHEKYFLNLEIVINKQLHKNGILHVRNENICTCCDKNFYSYRREKMCGRFCVGVKLLE